MITSPPVVLVHGWRSGPWIFNRLKNRLEAEGIETWIFDYSRESYKNPVDMAPFLSHFIHGMRQETGYEGSLDMISHSMGAMLSRFFCEVFDRYEGEHRIGKWIGIAPVNHGAPLADLFVNARENLYRYCRLYPELPKEIQKCMCDGAIVGTMTYGPDLRELQQAGLCSGIRYYVIAGHNPEQEYRFWPMFAGQTVAIRDKRYTLTYQGDGMVPNENSYLSGHPFILFSTCNDQYDMPPEWFNHNRLPRSPVVIDEVVTILLTP